MLPEVIRKSRQIAQNGVSRTGQHMLELLPYLAKYEGVHPELVNNALKNAKEQPVQFGHLGKWVGSNTPNNGALITFCAKDIRRDTEFGYDTTALIRHLASLPDSETFEPPIPLSGPTYFSKLEVEGQKYVVVMQGHNPEAEDQPIKGKHIVTIDIHSLGATKKWTKPQSIAHIVIGNNQRERGNIDLAVHHGRVGSAKLTPPLIRFLFSRQFTGSDL